MSANDQGTNATYAALWPWPQWPWHCDVGNVCEDSDIFTFTFRNRFVNPSECYRTRSKYGTQRVEHDGAIHFTLHVTVLEGESNRVLDVEHRSATIFVKTTAQIVLLM